jgi:hypothetical protein
MNPRELAAKRKQTEAEATRKRIEQRDRKESRKR